MWAVAFSNIFNITTFETEVPFQNVKIAPSDHL